MTEVVSSIVALLIVLGFLNQLQPFAEVLQSLWGGKVRELKRENEKLRRELDTLRLGQGSQLRARVETLETIVTDEDRELNRKLNRL